MAHQSFSIKLLRQGWSYSLLSFESFLSIFMITFHLNSRLSSLLGMVYLIREEGGKASCMIDGLKIIRTVHRSFCLSTFCILSARAMRRKKHDKLGLEICSLSAFEISIYTFNFFLQSCYFSIFRIVLLNLDCSTVFVDAHVPLIQRLFITVCDWTV